MIVMGLRFILLVLILLYLGIAMARRRPFFVASRGWQVFVPVLFLLPLRSLEGLLTGTFQAEYVTQDICFGFVLVVIAVSFATRPSGLSVGNVTRETALESVRQSLAQMEIPFEEKPPSIGPPIKASKTALFNSYSVWQFIVQSGESGAASILVGGLFSAKMATLTFVGFEGNPRLEEFVATFRSNVADKKLDKISPDCVAVFILLFVLLVLFGLGWGVLFRPLLST